LEKPSKKGSRGIITLILRILVAGGACWLILRNLHFGELVNSFRNLQVWVIGTAVAVKFIAETAMAFRWWMLLRSLDIVIPYTTALRLHFHGLFFSSFLPGSMGGDFIRAWYVTHHTHKRFQSALSVFVDRVTGLVSTGCIAVVTYFLYLRGQEIFTEKSTGFCDFFYRHLREILIAAVVLILLGLIGASIPAGRPVLVRAGRFLWQNGQKAIGHLRDVIRVFFRKLWLGPAALLLTITFQSLTFLSFWLIGRDLGVSDQIRYYFAIFPLVWFIGSIPISIAGLGILEGGVVVLFMTIAGSGQELAAAMALCQRAIFLLGGLPGIWIHLRADYLPKSKEEIFVDG
jgi:uncharacterized protein (TIRG00374 family)